MPAQPLHLEDSKALQNYYVEKKTYVLPPTHGERTTLHAETQVRKLKVIFDSCSLPLSCFP